MAHVMEAKARKEYTCSKCNNSIKVGDVYLRGTPFRMRPIIRCRSCGLRSWELSTSDYTLRVGAAVEDWRENYELGEDTAQEIADELSSLRDDLESSYDSMPEGLQYSENGERLQERIDNLDSAVSDLESIDYNSIKEGELGDSDYSSLTEEAREEIDTNINEALGEEIDNALSCLDY